jgi:hypothetical protein
VTQSTVIKKLVRERRGRERREGEGKEGRAYHMMAVSSMNSSTAELFVLVARRRLTATYSNFQFKYKKIIIKKTNQLAGP